ncbi:uncharacterized protein E0L32_009630 [Thyridium curvatum]|uniref:beta-N-acetylhexosaminidase n=1 Tax=Thyridium curvatum TaxID=1093900 RepID=A0A507AQG5_9PEZI|nr:uncharacterized protein E0L32_009630 [Thyridium curvatum]TPX08926.1 hypothetical protein E0L32_009630 [Thyridium curvatum]
MISKSIFSFLLLALLSSPAFAIWPIPKSYQQGNKPLFIHQNLALSYNGGNVCWNSFSEHSCPLDEFSTKYEYNEQLVYTYGYSPASINSKEIVQAGVSRALASIFQTNFVPWRLHGKNELSSFEPDVNQAKWIKSLAITQTGEDKPETFKPLAGQVDESYNLTLSEDGVAKLSAVTSTGVLRGLETFSQLFYTHSTGTFYYTPYAPVSIQDSPEYPHRGMLLDVARNFYPVKDIQRTIDALSWNKMNRLHVHITDSQSWPLDLPSMPEVAREGAYSRSQIYSESDLKGLQEYGVARGVEVVLEIDMPGHIGSLNWSHPELIVAYDAQPYQWWCAEPPCGAFRLNSTAVDRFLEAMFDDLLPRVAPYAAYFHTGGDELNANDSMLDPGIRSNKTEVLQPLLQKFVDAQHARVRKHGLTPMTWEEIPLNWNVSIGNDTVVQAWLGDASVKNLTAKGLQVIDSNYNYWYLDCGRGQWMVFDNGASYNTYYPFNDWCGPTKAWQLVYSHDPRAGLAAEQAARVLGGEVAVWSETIDPVNLDQVVWPRASAAGEVLWSGRLDPATGANRTQLDAAPRLNEFRERMVARGVGASVVQMTWCMQAANSSECAVAAVTGLFDLDGDQVNWGYKHHALHPPHVAATVAAGDHRLARRRRRCAAAPALRPALPQPPASAVPLPAPAPAPAPAALSPEGEEEEEDDDDDEEDEEDEDEEDDDDVEDPHKDEEFYRGETLTA